MVLLFDKGEKTHSCWLFCHSQFCRKGYIIILMYINPVQCALQNCVYYYTYSSEYQI